MSKKTYSFKDIKPLSLVTFEKHNGKGRPITHRVIFVTDVVGGCIFYDYFGGSMSALLMIDGKKKHRGNEWKIIDIKYFKVDENENCLTSC